MPKPIYFLVICLLVTELIQAQHLTVATYNLRYSIENNHKLDSTKGEDWKRRGPVIGAMVRFHEFDILGTQEGLLHQLEDLLTELRDYSKVGVGRDDGQKEEAHTAVLY